MRCAGPFWHQQNRFHAYVTRQKPKKHGTISLTGGTTEIHIIAVQSLCEKVDACRSGLQEQRVKCSTNFVVLRCERINGRPEV